MRMLRDKTGKIQLWQYLVAGLALLLMFGVIAPGNILEQTKDRVMEGLQLGAITGEFTGTPTGESTLPRVKVSIETPNLLEGTSGITCDSVEIFDQNFNRLGGDTSNDGTSVTIPNCIQGQNVYVYAKDTTAYSTLVKRTIPKVGSNVDPSAGYPIKEVGIPVKVSTSDINDYVLFGGSDIAGGNYNFTTSGQTPTWTLELSVATPANCQNEVFGADYVDPVLQKGHHAYIVIVSSVDENRVTSPGWTMQPGLDAKYYYKRIAPWEIDYLPDGTYSQLTLDVPVDLEITNSNSDAATLKVYWYDDVEDEEVPKLNFPSAFDSATITIQD